MSKTTKEELRRWEAANHRRLCTEDPQDYTTGAHLSVDEMSRLLADASRCAALELVFEAAGWPCCTCGEEPRVAPLSKTIYCDTPCEEEQAYEPGAWIKKQRAAYHPSADDCSVVKVCTTESDSRNDDGYRALFSHLAGTDEELP